MESILWVAFTAEARKKQLSESPNAITTFRKGPKWLRPELIGQRVKLVNCKVFHQPPCTEDCEVFAEGTVSGISYQRFADISEVDHARQSSDMTPENRLKIMQKVYGQDYDGNTLTTVVTITDLRVL